MNNKYKTNMVKVKEHKKDIKFLVIMIFCLILLLLATTTFMFQRAVNSNTVLEREMDFRNYGNQLVDASDLLTDKVYYYVTTGNKKYYDEYFYELEVAKNMDEAVEGLLSIGVTKEEQDIIESILVLSDKLTQLDMEAFELVENGKNEEAEALIFSKEHEDYVKQIHDNFQKVKDNIGQRVKNEGENVVLMTKATLTISTAVGIGTLITIILLVAKLWIIMKEADTDELTGLFNRNRYQERISNIIIEDPENYGALIYCDIDNLKFINDYYGHSDGDKYIQATANFLKGFGAHKSTIARLSGDEFIVYIHGFDNKDEMVSIINEQIGKSKNAFFVTSMREEEKIRFSTGVAIYPTDSNKIEELIKFADYTMYKMKKNSKGELAYYDSTTTDKTLILAKNNGTLNEFLDKEALNFALQPIIDAQTFEIYGYEALMRPTIEVIKSPVALLELAKLESKLDKIERLTMKKVFQTVDENIDKLKDCKIFINSIADQILTKEEFDVFAEQYPHVLKNIVLEITEQEAANNDILNRKINMFKSAGALAAIDDFGAGYSNENSLLSNDYDVIKVDMNLVRDIDTDSRRQYIVNSLIVFSNKNNYKILAEGVETPSEARMLRKLGIHYLQGYFIGRPDLEIKGISEQAKRFIEEETNI